MTNKDLYREFGNIDPEMVEAAAPAEKVQIKRRNVWTKWASIAACLIVVIGIGFSIPGIMNFISNDKPVEPNFELPTGIDNIIWGSSNDSPVSPDSADSYMKWNGWNVDLSLYEVLNSSDADKYIAIIVNKDNVPERDDFEYNGKKRGELKEEQDALIVLREKYIEFRGDEPYLKYGEDIYTTGTSEGEKWTKELYDEKVAYYGEDFINKYIVQGAFEIDLFSQDLLECEHRIGSLSNELVEIDETYQKQFISAIQKKFSKTGACVVVRDGKIYLFVVKEELADMRITNKGDYYLQLANRGSYEGITDQTQPPQIDDTVTGFDLNKIGLSNVDGCRTGAITSEEDLYVALNDLIGHWDNLMITIGSDNHIDQTELEEMNYSEVQHWKYPTRTVVFVNRSNLNMVALKELTLREDVSFVWVSEQLVPTDDNADVGPTPDGD